MISGLAFVLLTQSKIIKPPPAYFVDATTRKIVKACQTAHSKLKSARFTITSGSDVRRYSYATGRVSGVQGGYQWVFGNQTLTVKTGKGVFRGRVSPHNVNYWLNKLGSTERLPIQLISKQNPMTALLAPGSRVRRIGSVKVGNANADLVEIKVSGLRVSVGIRTDNHLIVDLSAENIDRNGQTLFRSSRSIAWTQVNAPIPANNFQLSGGKIQRIQALKK